MWSCPRQTAADDATTSEHKYRESLWSRLWMATRLFGIEVVIMPSAYRIVYNANPKNGGEGGCSECTLRIFADNAHRCFGAMVDILAKDTRSDDERCRGHVTATCSCAHALEDLPRCVNAAFTIATDHPPAKQSSASHRHGLDCFEGGRSSPQCLERRSSTRIVKLTNRSQSRCGSIDIDDGIESQECCIPDQSNRC
jgi:hypothetical protein